MTHQLLPEAVQRIRQMERIFDTLLEAADPSAIAEDPVLRESLQRLTRYYEGGQWLVDYELDEKQLLPRDLKRGVLAQDAVSDFLDRMGHVSG